MTAHALDDSVRSTPVARFKTYVLFRRGTLAPAQIDALVPRETWDALERLAILDDVERVRRERLIGLLHALVPCVSGAARRVVLAAKRDVHNGRLPGARTASVVRDALSPNAEAWDSWIAAIEEARRVRAHADATLETEMRAGRRHLVRLARTFDLAAALQLSGRHLYASVEQYAARIDGDEPVSDRRSAHTESTLVRYVVRCALRTAPFGTMTVVGAHPWTGAPVRPKHGATHLVRLNRGLLAWMTETVQRLPEVAERLRLTLNATAAIEDGVLTAFVRGSDGGTTAFWGERFVDVRLPATILSRLASLGTEPHSRAAVRDALRGIGLAADRADALLGTLLARGVLVPEPLVAETEEDVTSRVAERLEGVEGAAATRCHAIFAGLSAIERDFGGAPVQRRRVLLDTTDRLVREFAQACGVAQPEDIARSLLFEDVAAHEPARSWDPRLLETNVNGLERIARLHAAFDESIVEKRGLYRWFAQTRSASAPADALSVYRAFATEDLAVQRAILTCEGNGGCAALRAYRDAVVEDLAALAARAGREGTLRLDAADVDGILARQPAGWFTFGETSCRVQIGADAESGEAIVVLNDVASGYGAMYSRFCPLASGREWSLAEAIRGDLARRRPRQADLVATFGLNVNVHPALAPLDVVYPGASSPRPGALSLRDLIVVADDAAQILRLVERRTGAPVELVPMNFVFPAAAPLLYRFLCSFAPLRFYRPALFRRLAVRLGNVPRIRLGDVVVQRRRWRVPASELCVAAEAAGVDSLLAWEGVRARFALPPRCYVRAEDDAAHEVAAGGWTEQTRRWAVDARRARRKGQYIAFRNPFLLRILSQAVRDAHGAWFSFEECLPDAAADAGGIFPAEEFVVELRSDVV